MAVHERAGQVSKLEDRINIAKVVSDYFFLQPDVNVASQKVSFGTSGHRGSALKASFNEYHILAIVQAVAEYRKAQGFTGPLYLGKDTHALSEPAFNTAISVLIANDVPVVVQQDLGNVA